MTEPEYASFDDEAITKTLEAARQPYAGVDVSARTEITVADTSGLEMRAQCITVTSGNHRAVSYTHLTLPTKA